ncbi:hypothetical protein QPM17_03705 [Marinobacter sp. TBZ242]|uniref:Uncharacterized protein n=1 Tax=Marinobacter azerbaijanicus TaxID=3050455 RepID=A0ABT7IAN7_9GAMM|nr:hypothetical protein [Marinobacter sp. TBZ242]MDL0430214.1 hypothetical protein [Marinobacter sp. TBZ242]
MDYYQVEYTKYELAKLSFLECLDYLRLYEKGVDFFADSPLAFERALSKAFTITYARPFTHNDPVGGMGVGSISTGWIKKLPSKQRELHEELVGDGRNAMVAHLDIGKLLPLIFVKPGNRNDHIIDWRICSLNENSIDDLRALATAAHKYCFEHQGKIEPKIKDSIISYRQ